LFCAVMWFQSFVATWSDVLARATQSRQRQRHGIYKNYTKKPNGFQRALCRSGCCKILKLAFEVFNDSIISPKVQNQ